jgi:ABC-type nitrate/sulfonate/bicarbonate transport system substrate-binding protein
MVPFPMPRNYTVGKRPVKKKERPSCILIYRCKIYRCKPTIQRQYKWNCKTRLLRVHREYEEQWKGRNSGELRKPPEISLFEKNGIDAEVLYLQTTLGQTALLAGEIQMCVYSAALLAPARLQGADIVMVTSFLSRPLYRLVVKPDIRTTADLRGKRLGVTRFGTVSDWTTRLLLAKLGLDPEKDVTLVQVGDVPVLTAALMQGKSIDGAILQPPGHQRPQAAGMRVLVNMQEMDLPFQQTGLNTTQKFIARNPDIVRRVVKSVCDPFDEE